MARQIIILERTAPQFGFFSISAAFWLPVPVGQEAPRPGFTSAVRGPGDEPDATELAALQSGTVLERVTTWTLPSSYSLAAARTFLEVAWAAALANLSPPGQFYGQKWDGTGWVT